MTAVIYDLLYILPIALMTMFIGAPRFGGPEQSWMVYACGLAVTGVCVILKDLKDRRKFILPGVLLALALGIVLLQKPDDREDFILQNRWILAVTIAAVLSFLAGWIISSIRIVRRILAICLIAGLAAAMILKISFDGIKEAVPLALLIIVITAADEVQLHWKKSGYTDARGHLVSISPFLAALCLVVFLIPAPEKPYDWAIFIKVFDRISSGIKTAGRWFSSGSEEYGGTIGFSDTTGFLSVLQGKDRDKDIMTLTGGRSLGSVLYLTGKTMDHFDGRSWSADYEAENHDRTIDTIETICAVRAYDPDYLTDYIRKVQLHVTYEDFNTRYVFAPGKLLLQAGNPVTDNSRQLGADLLSDKDLGYGTDYLLLFMRLNREHEGFEEFLKNAHAPDRDAWDAERMVFAEGMSDISYDEYTLYRERIYEYYLPETELSDRAQAALSEVFEGMDSDVEKLYAAEEYLSKFEYLLSPGALPPSVDTPAEFLDHVLFESQKGYCSHFSTALVLIARNLGFPARYVQGFRVPISTEDTTTVRSSMAHGWPEVYIPGAGWIPFEPTPHMFYDPGWKFADRTKGDKTADTAVPDKHDEDEEDTGEETGQENTGTGSVISPRVILIPLGLVLLFLLLFAVADRALDARRYRRMNESEKFRLMCAKNLRLIKLLGFSMEQGETLNEFRTRVLPETGEECLGFLQDCELTSYADVTPDAAMLASAEADRRNLRNLIRVKKGRLRAVILWFY